jgi:hypothetical protein
VNDRRPGPAFGGRSQRWVSGAGPAPTSSPDAQRNYERYLALARAEAQSGNTVAAENYYQHAEHYFRTMSSNGTNSRKVSSSIRCENTGADATGSVRRRSKFLLISDLRLGGTRIRGRSQNAGIVRIASPSNATLLAPRLGIVVGGDNRLEMHETRA